VKLPYCNIYTSEKWLVIAAKMLGLLPGGPGVAKGAPCGDTHPLNGQQQTDRAEIEGSFFCWRCRCSAAMPPNPDQ